MVDERTLAFPDYDGNGMYRSWGNVLFNPPIALLFLDFENPKRQRVNGTAQYSADDLARTAGRIDPAQRRAARCQRRCGTCVS